MPLRGGDGELARDGIRNGWLKKQLEDERRGIYFFTDFLSETLSVSALHAVTKFKWSIDRIDRMCMAEAVKRVRPRTLFPTAGGSFPWFFSRDDSNA